MNSIVKVDWDSKLPIYEIPHFKLQNQGIKSLLIEDDEFDKVQPLIESELEKSSL